MNINKQIVTIFSNLLGSSLVFLIAGFLLLFDFITNIKTIPIKYTGAYNLNTMIIILYITFIFMIITFILDYIYKPIHMIHLTNILLFFFLFLYIKSNLVPNIVSLNTLCGDVSCISGLQVLP